MATIEEKRLSVEFLYAAVFTTVTVMVWVGLELIRSLTTPATIPQVTPEELKPLSADLSVEAVNQLRSREQIAQEQLDAFEVEASSLITSPVTVATQSASINVTSQQEATKSGGI